jgi:hypothetical protein
MLGYFGIYSQYGTAFFRRTGAQKRRLWLGLLPHEIAELNERSATQASARRAPRDVTQYPAEGTANPA